MASMESRMEVRKSGLARRGSGGDGGRRGYRYPSGRYRHWPGTDLAPVNVVVEGRGAGGASRRPSAPRDRIGTVGRVSGGGQLGIPCPGPFPFLI